MNLTLSTAPEILDCKQMAQLCNLGKFGYQHIAKLCKRGKIQSAKVGQGYRATKESFILFLKGKR